MTTFETFVALMLVAGVVALVGRLVVVMLRTPMAPRVRVCCTDGHYFTTAWQPYAPATVRKLGRNQRYLFCPVGRHWAVVTPVGPL